MDSSVAAVAAYMRLIRVTGGIDDESRINIEAEAARFVSTLRGANQSTDEMSAVAAYMRLIRVTGGIDDESRINIEAEAARFVSTLSGASGAQ